jgi:hypothetical protein
MEKRLNRDVFSFEKKNIQKQIWRGLDKISIFKDTIVYQGFEIGVNSWFVFEIDDVIIILVKTLYKLSNDKTDCIIKERK